jgi:MFS transporter, OPA family, glycerol-3-phosphate transporter
MAQAQTESEAHPVLLRKPKLTRYRRLQWRMLLAVVLCYLFYYTGRQTFGFAIPGIEKEFQLSRQEIGWISAGILWGYAIGQAINGNLGDKFGGRKVMAAGAILSSLMNWMMSFSIGFKTLLFNWWFNGYLQALGFAPGSRLVSNWWIKTERGKVYSLFLFCAGMSSVLTYVLGLVIVDVLQLDWRWIFRLPVLLLLIAGVLFYIIARDRPEEFGFQREAEHNDEVEALPSAVSDSESSLSRYKAVLSDIKIHITGLALGFQNAARYGLLIWVPVHFLGTAWKTASTTGLNPRWITVALPVGMAFGALSNGWISDTLFGSVRWKPIALYMAFAVITAALMYYLPTNSSWGIAALFLCGFFVYGPHSTFWALVPDLVGHRRAGTASGVVNAYSYVFAGLAEPMIGHLLDIYHDTALIFVVVMATCACSGLCATLIRK